ncbi:MAG: hypothetical protein ACFFB7_03860, partial [Candidatus Sifarchaeia archaeon]
MTTANVMPMPRGRMYILGSPRGRVVVAVLVSEVVVDVSVVVVLVVVMTVGVVVVVALDSRTSNPVSRQNIAISVSAEGSI